MQEIKVNVEQTSGIIGFNFEEIKEVLASQMQIYKGMVFTEDSKKEAKATIAELRKLAKAIDDKKKDVKKSFMQPYTDFETKVKELNALIDEPITFINGQVEEFEKKRISEKQKRIVEIYAEKVDGMENYLPFTKIYNSKWENATVSEKNIGDEITERVLAVRTDLNTIKAMTSEYEDKGLETYKRSLSLADAIQCIRNYENQALEIKKRQEEEERRKKELELKKEKEEPVKEKEELPDFVKEAEDASTKEDLIYIEEEKYNITYNVNADPFQLVQLESFMKENNIPYRRVQ